VFTDFEGSYPEYIKHSLTRSFGQNSQETVQKKAVKKISKKPSDTQKELRRLERDIDKLEKELESVKLVKDVFSTDYEKLMELDSQESELQSRLDGLLEEWEALA
jgi:uncharacterized protein YlxW (UPF0749 family)